jgi:hypothetical protein
MEGSQSSSKLIFRTSQINNWTCGNNFSYSTKSDQLHSLNDLLLIIFFANFTPKISLKKLKNSLSWNIKIKTQWYASFLIRDLHIEWHPFLKVLSLSQTFDRIRLAEMDGFCWPIEAFLLKFLVHLRQLLSAIALQPIFFQVIGLFSLNLPSL